MSDDGDQMNHEGVGQAYTDELTNILCSKCSPIGCSLEPLSLNHHLS